jgi:hypothetical protein
LRRYGGCNDAFNGLSSVAALCRSFKHTDGVPCRILGSFNPCCICFLIVQQENLILVDPDFFHDYSPYPALPDLRLPAGYAFVYTKGIPAAQMPVLLQRAKIVLDLGR